MPAAALDRTIPDEAAPAQASIAEARLSFSVMTSLEAAEPAWRKLEAEAVLTPYQRYDWIRFFVGSRDAAPALAIVVIEQDGAPIALLPLEVTRRMGVRIARIVGSDIGNGDWMPFVPRAVSRLGPEAVRNALAAAAGTADGIDLFMLRAQPESWSGVANPLLAFPHQPGPDHLYLGELDGRGSFGALDEKRQSHHLRRVRKLAKAHGEVVLHRASGIEEIERVHRTFLELRGVRFAQMGIPNIFAQPDFVKLFLNAAIASLGEPRPTLFMHALHAGDSIVATAIGGFGGDHYTQYINATAGGEFAKYRLISLLMHEVMTDVAAMGARSIDMGLGDFEYKNEWTVPVAVHDAAIPLTLRGRAAAGAILAGRRLKRAIKQHDRLWTLARKLRAGLGRRQATRAGDEHLPRT